MNSDSSSIDLVKTMEKKSYKKEKKEKKEKKHRKHNSDEVSDCNICCVPLADVVDCCKPSAKRLGELVNGWSNIATVGMRDMSFDASGNAPAYPNASWNSTAIAKFTNRAGVAIGVPVLTGNTDATSIFGSNGVNLIQFDVDPTGASVEISTATSVLTNALYSFLFVNAMRYLYYEKCGRLDQVMGWYVNISSGDLELYQDLPEQGIAMTVNRQTLLLIAPENLNPSQTKQLGLLNELYAISLKAVNQVRQEPKTEGNVLDVKLNCGNRVLIAINTASSDLSIASNNTAYTIVATGLY